MKTNKIIVTIVLMLVTILLLIGNTNAAYQSIPTGDGLATSADIWIKEIRKMEGSGQGMGLNETIDTSTYLAASASNNIDVHMLKNTEYGAIVLLGASDYGKQGTGANRYMDKGSSTTSGTDVKASSTGNVYGIYELGYHDMDTTSNGVYEWTAGGSSSFLNGIAPRYINRYTTEESSARSGDATVETKNWMGSRNAIWLGAGSNGFIRGYSGVFTYYNNYAGNSSYCRAGVVVGAGL